MAQPDPSSPDPTPAAPRSARHPSRALGLLLALAGVSLFGLLLLRLVAPRPVPPPTVVHYTPQQATDARKDIASLGTQLLAPPPAAPTPGQVSPPAERTRAVPPASLVAARPAAPVRLQLSEADLNTYLATDPKVKTLLASRGVQAVQIFLQAPHTVTCRASVLYQGRKNNVQITGDLLPDPDTVARFVAAKAQVGALPLPPKLVTAQADRIAGQFLGRVRGRLPVKVQGIQVIGHVLVLTGVRRPVPRP